MVDRARKAWMDLTIRVTELPEMNVQPDGSIEILFLVPEMDLGEVVLLVPRKVLAHIADRAQEILLTTVP